VLFLSYRSPTLIIQPAVKDLLLGEDSSYSPLLIFFSLDGTRPNAHLFIYLLKTVYPQDRLIILILQRSQSAGFLLKPYLSRFAEEN